MKRRMPETDREIAVAYFRCIIALGTRRARELLDDVTKKLDAIERGSSASEKNTELETYAGPR